MKVRTQRNTGAPRPKFLPARIVLLILSAILMASLPLRAQSFYGSIVGTVTDGSGAIVPGATVTVTNLGTAGAQTAQTDNKGEFSFVNLTPADYKVEVNAAGFKRFLRDRINVGVGATARADTTLQVGVVTETINVSTAPPMLQSDSSSLSEEITGEQVKQMPLNGRNVQNLIALAPGVVPTGGSQGDAGLNQGTRTAGGAGWGNYEIGGSIQGQSAEYIDGVPNNVLGGNTIALIPTQDAVQEFSVLTSVPSGDFGRFGGGVVNMTTKSGANAFHGTAYEYLRNRDFNANDFFSNRAGSPRPQFNQNQYGLEVSGPIKRDKAFFLFTYEGFAALTGIVGSTNVPTSAASRAKWGGSDIQDGIFPDAIVDPLGRCNISTTVNPGYWTITNLNQGSCGDPLNNILKTYYPDPNQNPNTNSNDWFLTTPLANHQKQYNGRVDYTISDKQRLFGRYTYWKLNDTGHSEFLQQGLNGTTWPTNDGHNSIYTHQFALGDTNIFNPKTILDVRLSYVRQTDPNLPDSTSVNEGQFGSAYSTLSNQMLIHTLPAFNASGGLHNLYNMGNFPNYQKQIWNNYAINANLTKLIGSHNFKFGAELRLMDQSGSGFVNDGSGGYTYNTNFTGDEWASFLMGYPTQINFVVGGNTASYSYYQAYYVTDTWQVSRKLTLNLGLRYELPGAISERNNKATVLLPNATDPYTGITGTLSLVDSALYPHRSTVLPEQNLFAPRVGFSYRAFANTVISGAYGLSYLPNDLTDGTLPYYSLVNSATTQVNIPGSGAPTPLQTSLATLAATGLTQPIGRTEPDFMTQYASKTSYLGQTITGPVPNQPFPYVQQWNVAVNHQFNGEWLAGLAYFGMKGTNLPGMPGPNSDSGRSLDELSSQYYSLGAALLNTAPCANANDLELSVGQCLRKYPYYNDVQDTAEFYGYQNYDALQARLEKRFGSTGTINANYTFAKNLSNTDTQNGYLETKSTQQGGNGNGYTQDWNNLNGEYSLVSFDVTNRMVVSYVLNLPFGKGQKYGGNLLGVGDRLASGWAVNGITTVQSGFPLFFSTSQENQLQSSFGAGVTRPNVLSGCSKKVGGSGLARVNKGEWFNTACFAYPGDYAFGNESRVDGQLRGDGIKNFDFAVQKSTRFYKTANLEFRTEFFNIFNRVQFAPPINTQGASNFGQVTYQANQPRQIQFSLRVNY